MGTIRVIAFEDELLHAERIRSAVEELGYHLVDILESTREIEMIAMSLKPDIILMDIDLGTEETGIDAVKRLRKKSAVPVIFTTSYLSNEVFNFSFGFLNILPIYLINYITDYVFNFKLKK